MSHTVTTDTWCDEPGCGKFTGAVVDRGSGSTTNKRAKVHLRESQRKAEAEGWVRVNDKDYCRIHKAKQFRMPVLKSARGTKT